MVHMELGLEFYDKDYIDNPTVNQGDDEIIVLRFLYPGNYLQYKDYEGNFQTIGVVELGEWQYLSWEITAPDTVVYELNGTVVSGTPYNVSGIYNGNKIDRLHIFGVGSSGYPLYIDDHTITTGVISSGNYVPSQCGYIPDSDNIGILKAPQGYPISEQWLEIEHQVPMTATFNYLDIMVDVTQYFHGSQTLSDYKAYLNGVYLGTADCFFRYGDGAIIRFAFSDKTLTNQKPLIEVRSATKLNNSNNYWFIAIGSDSNDDLDNDGYTGFKYNIDPQNTGAYNGISVNYDISYQLYYDSIVTPDENPDLTNSLTLNGYEGKNSITNIPYYYNRTSVFISYTIDTLAQSTYIRIFNVDTSVELGLNQGFGISNILTSYSGTKGFTPTIIGNYSVKMYRSGVYIINESFYVVETSEIGKSIWSIPNPSNGDDRYKVYYDYIHPDGWKGAVAMNDEASFNSKSEANFWVEIVSGTTGSFDFYPSTNNNEYWRLFVSLNNGSTFIPYSGIHQHLKYDNSQNGNYVNVVFDNIILSNNPESQKSQIIKGYHSYLGGGVVVKINGVAVKDVSATQTFSFSYKPISLGYKNVTLEFNNNGTYTVLDYVLFTVSDDSGNIESDTGMLDYSLYIGIFIIVVFAMMGLGLAQRVDFGDKIFIIALFTTIGVAISWILELTPTIIVVIYALLLLAFIIDKLR